MTRKPRTARLWTRKFNPGRPLTRTYSPHWMPRTQSSMPQSQSSQTHTRTQQSMQNRHNSSRKEESEHQQGVKTVHQQLPSSPVCFKSTTLLPCLLKLFFQKAYGKGWVSVWGYVLYRCAYANSLCRKLFEKGGVLLSVFCNAIMSTDYRLDSSWVLTSTGPDRVQHQRGGNK